MKLEERGRSKWPTAAFAVVLLSVSLTLQGCDLPRVDGYFDVGEMKVPAHRMAVWRMQEDYYDKFGFMDGVTHTRKFNSCMDPNMNALNVCSGRGKCMPFQVNDLANPLFICSCDWRFADPECGTKRKSQAVAWMLSLFTGYLGFDEFYLMFPERGVLKFIITIFCAALYGLSEEQGELQRVVAAVLFNAVWLIDIVRIGSAPVSTKHFALAPDLPRWAFSVITMTFMISLGILIGVKNIYYAVTRRRRKATALSYGISTSTGVKAPMPGF